MSDAEPRLPDNAGEVAVKKLPRNVKLLGMASLVNDIASEMIFPLLPRFVMVVLGGTKGDLGLIEGLADSTASILKLFSGGWSDRLGSRRGFVVFGYALGGLVRPLIALATAPWHVVAVRVSDRIGKGVRTAPRDAMIADSAPPQMHGRAFAFHRAMDHLGAAIGPLLAALLLFVWPNQFRLVIGLTLLPGLLLFLLLFFGLKEPANESPPKPRFSLSLRPFGANFWFYLVTLVVFTLGNSSDVFLLVRAGELGVPSEVIPLLWAAFHIVKSGATLLAGGAIDRLGPRPMIVCGWAVYALIYLAFALATEAWHVWAFFLVYAIFYALTEPAEKTLVAALVGPERKGLAYGWYNFSIGVAILPSNIIFGWIYERFGHLAAFGWGASLALLSSIMLLFVRARSTQQGG